MDNTCRLWGWRAAPYRPSTRFLRPGGEIGYQVEQGIAAPYQPVQPRLSQSQCFEIFAALIIVELRQFFFNSSRNHYGFGALGGRFFGHFGCQRIAVRSAVFLNIADINHRLGGNQLQVFEVAFAAFGYVGLARRSAFAQFGQCQFNQFQFINRGLVFGGRFFA